MGDADISAEKTPVPPPAELAKTPAEHTIELAGRLGINHAFLTDPGSNFGKPEQLNLYYFSRLDTPLYALPSGQRQSVADAGLIAELIRLGSVRDIPASKFSVPDNLSLRPDINMAQLYRMLIYSLNETNPSVEKDQPFLMNIPDQAIQRLPQDLQKGVMDVIHTWKVEGKGFQPNLAGGFKLETTKNAFFRAVGVVQSTTGMPVQRYML